MKQKPLEVNSGLLTPTVYDHLVYKWWRMLCNSLLKVICVLFYRNVLYVPHMFFIYIYIAINLIEFINSVA